MQYIVIENWEGELNTFSAELWPTRAEAVAEVISRIKREAENDELDEDDLAAALIQANMSLHYKNSISPFYDACEYAIIEVRQPGEPPSISTLL